MKRRELSRYSERGSGVAAKGFEKRGPVVRRQRPGRAEAASS